MEYGRHVAVKLIFQQQQFEFKDTTTSDDVIEKINELLQKNYYFSYFIVDGTEIHEDPESYLIVNLGRIEMLEIVAKTEKEFVNDILLSTEDYLKRAKPELTSLPEGFYANPTPQTYTSFVQLIDGLQWLDEMISVIGNSDVRPSNWKEYLDLSKNMKSEIFNLSDAVDNSDNILVADIIQYEIIPIFDLLETTIGNTIDTEGVRHDLS